MKVFAAWTGNSIFAHSGKNMVFSLILVPIQPGTPRLLPLYSRFIFDYRQKNPLQYHILPDALLLDSSGPGMKKDA